MKKKKTCVTKSLTKPKYQANKYDEDGFTEFEKCPLCGCMDCPHEKLCVRRQQKPEEFRPCPACGCLGTWQFSTSLTTDEIITEKGEQLDMLPQPTSRRTAEPSARAGNNASGGVPKLTVRECTFDKRQARIIGVRAISGKYGEQIVVKLSYNSSAYLWYLNPDNPNYDLLVEKLGQDEGKWVDASLMIANVEDDFNGKTWPTASDIEPSGKKKK